MKNLRKLFAVTLLILTLALPTYAEGQMETPLVPPTKSSPAVTTVDEGSDAPLPQNGQMETPKTAMICLIETILALI